MAEKEIEARPLTRMEEVAFALSHDCHDLHDVAGKRGLIVNCRSDVAQRSERDDPKRSFAKCLTNREHSRGHRLRSDFFDRMREPSMNPLR